MESRRHVPVMRDQVIGILNPGPGGIFLDATFGAGGHSRAILDRILPTGRLIGIDRDPEAIAHGRRALQSYETNVRLVLDDFGNLTRILETLDIAAVDGIVADLGVSTDQLLDEGRGFSFSADTDLDMRMDPTSDGPTARDIVNRWPEKDLADLFFRLGEERHSRRIARAVVSRRAKESIRTGRELGDIVRRAVPRKGKGKPRIHEATRVFQALRIEVNHELSSIERLLDSFWDALKPGGRAAIISFHSLEDRLVKEKFRALARGCVCPPGFPCVCREKSKGRILTKKPVRPTPEEIEENPMARSAKLRAFEKSTEERESEEGGS